MILTKLNLPFRELKPRKSGVTILIDNGVPLNFFKDSISSSAELVDFVKFGWGTSIITKQLAAKINCLQEHNVDFFFGGTLFEKFLSQGKLDNYYNYCKEFNCKYIEISNGTIDLENQVKARFIREFSKDFTVFSEVGHKDSELAEEYRPEEWVEYIQEDFEAGAEKVITEARESGTSGICKANGEPRLDLIDGILSADLKLDNIIFEAPTKKLQTLFIKMAGTNVNLANIPFSDTISLETLRLGLRSDTFFMEVNHTEGELLNYERNK